MLCYSIVILVALATAINRLEIFEFLSLRYFCSMLLLLWQTEHETNPLMADSTAEYRISAPTAVSRPIVFIATVNMQRKFRYLS